MLEYPGGRKFMLGQFVIVTVSLAVGFALIWLLPFPAGIASAFALMICTMFFTRRRLEKKLGLISGSSSSSVFGKLSFGGSNFECLGCGNKHKQRACPKCGSKMRRLAI